MVYKRWKAPQCFIKYFYIIKKISKPESALGLRYPMSEFSRMAINFGDINPRYRYDNIL